MEKRKRKIKKGRKIKVNRGVKGILISLIFISGFFFFFTSRTKTYANVHVSPVNLRQRFSMVIGENIAFVVFTGS